MEGRSGAEIDFECVKQLAGLKIITPYIYLTLPRAFAKLRLDEDWVAELVAAAARRGSTAGGAAASFLWPHSSSPTASFSLGGK